MTDVCFSIWMKKAFYIISLIFVVGMMVLIYRFSSEDAVDSSSLSGGVCETLVEGANDTFSLDMTQVQIQETSEVIETPIRKCAHFLEYALLSFVMQCHIVSILFLKMENVNKSDYFKKRSWIGMIFCVLYAISDEVHQLFVPGRACRLFDVGVDSLGAMTGLLTFLIVWILCEFLRRKLSDHSITA